MTVRSPASAECLTLQNKCSKNKPKQNNPELLLASVKAGGLPNTLDQGLCWGRIYQVFHIYILTLSRIPLKAAREKSQLSLEGKMNLPVRGQWLGTVVYTHDVTASSARHSQL